MPIAVASGTVTALRYPAAAPGLTLVLGHGAGAPQTSDFMVTFARAFARRGLTTVTFNFPYMEARRRMPDRAPVLEAAFRAVIEAVRERPDWGRDRLVIGGKSMGGRIASQVAAEDSEGIDGLVFLGYPLHPPGRLDKMRDEHLPKIKAPMLFVQGSRDAFGTEEEIRAIIKKHKLKANLYVVASGDHSFKVPKSIAPQQQVYEDVMDEVMRWCPQLWTL
jgi:predicted alpha/beta-hydrolase family hydrolase